MGFWLVVIYEESLNRAHRYRPATMYISGNNEVDYWVKDLLKWKGGFWGGIAGGNHGQGVLGSPVQSVLGSPVAKIAPLTWPGGYPGWIDEGRGESARGATRFWDAPDEILRGAARPQNDGRWHRQSDDRSGVSTVAPFGAGSTTRRAFEVPHAVLGSPCSSVEEPEGRLKTMNTPQSRGFDTGLRPGSTDGTTAG